MTNFINESDAFENHELNESQLQVFTWVYE